MKKVYIVLILTFLTQLPYIKTFAQKSKRISGESHIKIEINQSRLEAEKVAVEQAIVDALTEAFGQYVEYKTDTRIESEQVDFKLYGGTKVKGEWIRTVDGPVFSYDLEGAETWITCKIKGIVRGISAKTNVLVEVLSSPEKVNRKEKFKNNENMYLYVKSPSDGYLSVFLDDGETVYRLLPYSKMGSIKSVKIKGDQEYILFSQDIDNFNVRADKIQLFTKKDYESNTVVVVFSEKEFPKPLLNEEEMDDNIGLIIPRSLSKKKFEEWLGDNRAADEKFLDIEKRVIIEKE